VIRATAATWLNYATTLIFQVLFAARFGTSSEAGAYVVTFAAAVSLGGVFVTTTLTIALPRMLDARGALARPAVRFLGVVGSLIVFTSLVVGLSSSALAAVVAPILDVARVETRGLIIFAAAFLAATALAGVLGSVALARGRRFLPAILPAVPSTVGAVYLSVGTAPTTGQTFAAVAAGAALQLAIMIVAVLRPMPRVANVPPLRLGFLTLLTVSQLLLFGLLPVLQRLLAAVGDSAGPARFDYAFRGVMAAQQLLIGGLLIAILPDWAALHQRAARIGHSVVRAWIVGGFALTTAATLALVAAPSIVQLIFQRGAFTAEDTQAVALLARLLLPGFVAEGVTLIVFQGLFATARNDLALQLGFVRFGVQALLTLVLGLALGSTGVAIAYSISLTAALAYALIISSRIGLLAGGRHLMLRSGYAWLLTAAAGVVVMAAGTVLTPWLGTLLVLLIALLTVVGFGLGGPLMRAFGAVPDELHDEL
jgi:putative peptidoglycan lipid II flippase